MLEGTVPYFIIDASCRHRFLACVFPTPMTMVDVGERGGKSLLVIES